MPQSATIVSYLDFLLAYTPQDVYKRQVVDTVIEGNESVNESGFESVSEMAQTSDQAAVTEPAQENFVQTELPLQNLSLIHI